MTDRSYKSMVIGGGCRLVGIIAFMTSVSSAATLTWTNNLNGSWHDSQAWNPASTPLSTDDAVIRNGGIAM